MMKHLITLTGILPMQAGALTRDGSTAGPPLADIARGLTHGIPASQQDALLAFTGVLGPDVNAAQVHRALVDLAEARAPAFNAANPDAPGVTYVSSAGYSTLFGLTNWNAD